MTAQMVGDRRFPGATILGGGSLLLPPTIPCQSRRLVPNLVMDSLSGLFWDFGSLFRTLRRHFLTRCRRQPSSSSSSLRRLRLGVAAQASGTSLSDVSATQLPVHTKQLPSRIEEYRKVPHGPVRVLCCKNRPSSIQVS